MSTYFQNKVIAITGGSDGIGKAIIEALLPLGAKIATCGRNADKLNALKTQHSEASLLTVVADVSNYNDCKNFIDTTISTYGGIDILINNAGISMRALLQDADVDVIKKVMDINFYGTVYCTKLALNSVIERKGTIVGVSSVAGYRGLPGRTGYSASKYAVDGFLESLRTELLNTGVHVMWVCPGFTASNIRNTALTKDGSQQGQSPFDEHSLMTAEECAAITLKAIEKRKRTQVYSIADKRTIWLNKLFPGLTDKLVHNFFFKNEKLVK
ncbi:MAG: SDR family oxidoreductase [Ferruginibacter sp.]